MPPKAEVAIFEDDEMFLPNIRYELRDSGHTIVAEAKTMQDADDLLPKLGELNVKVALVDGNLSPRAEDGTEGAGITRRIKQMYPDIQVVGISLSRPVVGADQNMTKTQMIDNRFSKGPTIGDLVTKI